MSSKTLQRGQLRILHLLAAAPVMAFFYGPQAGSPWLEAVLRFAVLPVLALSGIVMWQLPRVRRYRAARRRGGMVQDRLLGRP